MQELGKIIYKNMRDIIHIAKSLTRWETKKPWNLLILSKWGAGKGEKLWHSLSLWELYKRLITFLKLIYVFVKLH